MLDGMLRAGMLLTHAIKSQNLRNATSAAALYHRFGTDLREMSRGNVAPCVFTDALTEGQLERIVQDAKDVSRQIMQLTMCNGLILGLMTARHSNNSWPFAINFNDGGHITGRYTVDAANKESQVPWKVAQYISERITATKAQNAKC